MSFERLVAEIGRLTVVKPCVVVAVDGHSAAGKSSIGRRLAESESIAVVQGDDFYAVMAPDVRAELSAIEGADRYYDWSRMRSVALDPLVRGRTARYRPYNWDTNQLANLEVLVQPSDVVVVEGLFASRPELADLVDIAVLVETDEPVRRQRQAERSDATPFWLDRWDRAERYFFESVRPPATFDIRISGTATQPT